MKAQKSNPDPVLDDRTKSNVENNGEAPTPDLYNPLNPESFLQDESELNTPIVKPSLTVIPIRKPDPADFIRVHPNPAYRKGPVSFINLKKSREYYLVNPALRKHLKPREYWIGEVFLAIDRYENPFFWIATLQSPTGRISDWYTSGIECAEKAMRNWVQVIADQAAGVYTVALSEDQLEEPEWPPQTFVELFDIGFKRRTVDSLEHPVFTQLRGRKV